MAGEASMKRFKLDCGSEKCCPEAIIIDDCLTLEDDYQESVTLTAEQTKKLREILNREIPK